MIETLCLPAGEDSINQAAALLRAGRVVAFPTETVYGLGADALNSQAVRDIFAAKTEMNKPRSGRQLFSFRNFHDLPPVHI